MNVKKKKNRKICLVGFKINISNMRHRKQPENQAASKKNCGNLSQILKAGRWYHKTNKYSKGIEICYATSKISTEQ